MKCFNRNLLVMLCLVATSAAGQATLTQVNWADVQKAGKGTLTAYWYESRPFIYRDTDGKMRGIEPDIMERFTRFLKEVHKLDVTVNWQEATSFEDIYERIKVGKSGSVGVSAYSITPERQQYVGFAPPYMADISVLISSADIPIAKDSDDFNRKFSDITAITIRGTTYEQDLLKLKDSAHLNFKLSYIPSSQNILSTIESIDHSFGFIDLPIYMMMFNENPSIKVRRQNLYPIKRQGYAFIFPMGSDWSIPLREFFKSDQLRSSLEPIISKYINVELYRFVEGLSIQTDDPVILLTKEKEIQQRDILGKAEQIALETRRSNLLIGFTAVVCTFLFIIIILYKKRNDQKVKIEAQGKSLATKTDQLEKRNIHLVALDEEKNNLIKILAHDLRTPINHVQGLAQVFLLTNPQLNEEQKASIVSITEASVRLNKMITHILDIDALENNRVKVFMDEVQVTALVSQVVQSFEKQALKKNIQLHFDAEQKHFITGDSLFLIQIFENLLSNAIKFSSPGKKVDVTVREMNGKVTIGVQDEGPGLTEEDRQHIFKKFQRLSAQPTGGESSVGLGLSIVKQYAELMRGRVWCESKPGKGATFCVEFERL